MMLKELSKKFRKIQQGLVEEYFRIIYNIVFEEKRRQIFVSLKLTTLRDLKELD